MKVGKLVVKRLVLNGENHRGLSVFQKALCASRLTPRLFSPKLPNSETLVTKVNGFVMKMTYPTQEWMSQEPTLKGYGANYLRGLFSPVFERNGLRQTFSRHCISATDPIKETRNVPSGT
jgi:hypothetical protein